MDFISRKDLESLLDDQLSLRLGQDEVCISPSLCFVVQEDIADFKLEGFEVEFEGKTLTFEDTQAVADFVESKLGKSIPLFCISDQWNSLKEYQEYKAFCNISMQELLQKYAQADSFSLTGCYNDGYSQEHPHGIFGIEPHIAQHALEQVQAWSMQALRSQYDHFTAQEKASLPAFEQLVQEIMAECDEYFALVQKGLPQGQSPFLCDLIFEGKTKYREPNGIWHFYHNLYGQSFHYQQAINEMSKNTKMRTQDYIFEQEYYAPLKNSLIKTEVTFCWHCTTTSRLSTVYYFRLDERALRWLSRLKNDYDMHELQDLAFYKQGKCIFSSCTHENFHNNLED